jgi:hypothetical protein
MMRRQERRLMETHKPTGLAIPLPRSDDLDWPFGKAGNPPQCSGCPVRGGGIDTGGKYESQNSLPPRHWRPGDTEHGPIDPDEQPTLHGRIDFVGAHSRGERLPARHEAVLAFGQSE